MIPEQQYSVIIVAGGKGIRAGGKHPKQFQLLGEKPMLMHTLQAFYDYSYRMRIVLVLPDGFDTYWHELCQKHAFDVPHKTVVGGETRFHSVKNGLAEIAEDETVGVHDAARPFVSAALIGRCFDTAFNHHCGVIPVIDEVNSLRLVSPSGNEILDRNSVKIVQTPQVFPAATLLKAYNTNFDPAFTDDASVFEQSGEKIHLVSGEESNIKITTSFDFVVAEQYLNLLQKNRF